uniref:Uncharacterized protein n=1 Tax=Suricata suricatta TaxID=37032 RepID=A0A673UR04_SURSU
MILHQVGCSGSAPSSYDHKPGHPCGGRVPQNLTPDGVSFMLRVPHERKKENRKPEELPSDQPLPGEQMLQRRQGAWVSKDKARDTATKDSPSLGQTGLRKDAKGEASPGHAQRLPVLKSVLCLGVSPWSLVRYCGPSLQVHVVRLPPQGPFHHFMDMKAEKRLVGWKEHRSRFGDVSAHKCSQLGQIFSPFQALTTTEMRTLAFSRGLPKGQHRQRTGSARPANGNRLYFSLSSTELGAGKDDDNHTKERPAGHIKMPLLPPVVKATKSNDVK